MDLSDNPHWRVLDAEISIETARTPNYVPRHTFSGIITMQIARLRLGIRRGVASLFRRAVIALRRTAGLETPIAAPDKASR